MTGLDKGAPLFIQIAERLADEIADGTLAEGERVPSTLTGNDREGIDAPEWSWDEVGNLWGKPGINSGGGQWCPPSFDGQGNIYIGVANPAPLGGVHGYPWGTSRPGPNLYTDSVVKLSPQGKLLWYYQLTPHDLFDWDIAGPRMLAAPDVAPPATQTSHRRATHKPAKRRVALQAGPGRPEQVAAKCVPGRHRRSERARCCRDARWP